MSGQRTEDDPEVAPERVGLAWIGSDRAVIVRWEDEPVVEHVDSGVTPRRRAVGSVRRGPARPAGGGRVPGHGTTVKHDDELRQFLADLAYRLVGLEVVEVAGRGGLPERLADLLRSDATSRHEEATVTTRALSRRPSDAQLKARLRRLADRELPRRGGGGGGRGGGGAPPPPPPAAAGGAPPAAAPPVQLGTSSTGRRGG